MVVYNVNPEGSDPIVIVTKWTPDPEGGPALPTTTYMIAPGEGIDLTLIGLAPKETEPTHG